MRNKYLLRRLLISLVMMILFSLCAATLGFVNALQFSILLLGPILIISVGAYFLGKSLKKKGNYSNLLAISVPAFMFFAFSFLGMAFDPRNPAPFGLNTFLISGTVGFGVFLLGLLAIAFQKLLNKQ